MGTLPGHAGVEKDGLIVSGPESGHGLRRGLDSSTRLQAESPRVDWVQRMKRSASSSPMTRCMARAAGMTNTAREIARHWTYSRWWARDERVQRPCGSFRVWRANQRQESKTRTGPAPTSARTRAGCADSQVVNSTDTDTTIRLLRRGWRHGRRSGSPHWATTSGDSGSATGNQTAKGSGGPQEQGHEKPGGCEHGEGGGGLRGTDRIENPMFAHHDHHPRESKQRPYMDIVGRW